MGGTFVVDGDGDFSQNQGSANYRIENAGTFIKRGAGTATVVNGPIAFMNRGDLECESGLLQFGGSYQHDEVTSRLVLRGGSVQRDGGLIFAGGGVEGGGTLIGPVVNAGAVMAVGTGGDQLRIEGSYVQLSGGTLRSTLAGSADGGALRHVALAVSGMATLDGGWEVAVAFPFAEALGADFAVVSYGSRVGEFGSVDGLSDNFGYGFTRSFEVGALHLAVTGEGEVAGPGLFRAMVSTGFDHWMQGQLQGVEEEVDSAREGDPDGDGASNWMEYAFGTSPRDAASRPVIAPILGQETGGLRAGLVYRSRSDNARLDYRVEVSGDLKEWALLEGAEIQRRPVPGLPLDEVEVKLAAGLPPEGKLYLRVKVEER